MALMGLFFLMLTLHRLALTNEERALTSANILPNDLMTPQESRTPSMKAAINGKGSLRQEESSTQKEQPTVKVVEQWKPPSFLEAGRATGTDKVKGPLYLPECLEDDAKCTRPSCQRETCRPWGHFYHTLYQQKLEKFAGPNAEPFQLLEIGFNYGWGYEAFQKFFERVNGAEFHSIEISCIEEGPREEGKWPWGNFAKASAEYDSLIENHRLHCGDAANVTWLDEMYTQHMLRHDAPPLKIVVEDGSHLAPHMVQSVFFWFPRIEPGGLLIVEDIQPIHEANKFRTQFLPQIMSDLHFCGDPAQEKDMACFPQLYPLLQSIHCEMHICVFERNQVPAIPNLSLEQSMAPSNALDMSQCYSLAKAFGIGLEDM
jgi:hypothetical protein